MKTTVIKNSLLWRKTLYQKYGLTGFENVQDPNKWTDKDKWLVIFPGYYMSVSEEFYQEVVKDNPDQFYVPVYVTDFLEKLKEYV